MIYKAIFYENHLIIKIDGLDITTTSGAFELYNPPWSQNVILSHIKPRHEKGLRVELELSLSRIPSFFQHYDGQYSIESLTIKPP